MTYTELGILIGIPAFVLIVFGLMILQEEPHF
jgi:hypothetical protein